ncbi:hypothetical protein GCM10023201_37460 [Actinomycetospora corticicola]|uniref:Dynamin family protein n=1 Tax=Actinomycetospora corticicola TaxID=663602 RepID=A0A7Y9DZC5_9PSEU|nr:hypothetical protein [Actinomycetospora corticicola]NYD38150.1 hypothetical protein [Actinomycetospora corticicola]
MSGDPARATLPEEVAAARRDLTRVLAEAGLPTPGPPAAGDRPAVALVGAPGRGRRALAAALVDRDPAALGREIDHLTAGSVDVPLLEELDLLLPARSPDGGWSVAAASALLVVVGAGAPLDRHELDRLAAAADTVEAVTFALVGTEAHRGWRTVLEADRELVAEHVPRLAAAPWFPVSPVLAAAARGTGTDGEALRRRAGLAPLQRSLYRLVARRRRMLAEANALRCALGALRAVHVDDPAPELQRRRAALEAARTGLRREHHVRWRAELAGARVAVVDDVGRRVRALAAAYRDRIDRASSTELGSVEADLARDLEGEAAAVVAALGERLRELVVGTLAGLVPADDLAALRIPAPTARPDLPPGTRRRADRMLVVAGATGGLGLSRLALLPLLAVPVAPVVGAALVPVSVGLGLGAAGWLARARRRAADRAHARAWLVEALGQARTDLERVLSEALIVADREITLALDRALDEHGRRLDAELAGLARRPTDRVLRDRDAAARRAEAVLGRLAAALAAEG